MQPSFNDLFARYGLDAVSHSDCSLKDHSIETCKIMERWGLPPEICQAGLFHSIYGTETFPGHVPLSDRQIIRDVIGETSERYVYLFCCLERQSLLNNLPSSQSPSIVDRFTSKTILLTHDECSILFALLTANFLEQQPRSTNRYMEHYRFLLNAKHFIMDVAFRDLENIFSGIISMNNPYKVYYDKLWCGSVDLYDAYKTYYESLIESEKYTSSVGFVSTEFIDNLFSCFEDAILDVSYIRLRSEFIKLNPPTISKFHRHLMTTGGTSKSVRRYYYFGPHFEYIKRALWEKRMFPKGKTEIVHLIVRMEEDFPPRLIKSFSTLYNNAILTGRLCESSIKPLIDIIDSIDGQVTLLSVPDSFLFLNKNPLFFEYCVKNKNRLNLMSQQWENFYRKKGMKEAGVHVSDVMMDWSTGTNFHTCSAGEYHVLPISVAQQNLLNLVPFDLDWVSNADLFETWGLARCDCGKNRLMFVHHPHSMMNISLAAGYDIELAEKLETNFQCIQFHQHESNMTIFYEAETDVTQNDRDFLMEYWEKFGFTVHWNNHQHYQTTGYKRPVFFKYLP